MSFDAEELNYYSRQMRLPEIGIVGQEKLRAASVLLIGLGGLGSPLALYLAGAGVGRLGLVEFDHVDASNLHRQILFGVDQAGMPKLECGIRRLRGLNPHIRLDAHPGRLTAATARDLIRRYDIIADGSDNFATRYSVNDACVSEGKPLVSASVSGFEGQLGVFNYRNGPCYRCLYPQSPTPGLFPTCGETGILGVLPGVMGTLQACAVLKIILGLEEGEAGRVLHFQAASFRFLNLRVSRSPDCPACSGLSPLPTETEDSLEIDPRTLVERMRAPGASDLLLIDVRENHEREAGMISESIHRPLSALMSAPDGILLHKTIVIYCESGFRSLQATAALRAKGYDVVSLAGGFKGYKAFSKLQ